MLPYTNSILYMNLKPHVTAFKIQSINATEKCAHKKHNMSKLFTKFLHLNKKKALSKVTVKISIQGKEYYNTFTLFLWEQSCFFNSGTQQRLMKHARRAGGRQRSNLEWDDKKHNYRKHGTTGVKLCVKGVHFIFI